MNNKVEQTCQARWRSPFGCRRKAPEVFDIGKETAATRARYGENEFGRGCLMACGWLSKASAWCRFTTENASPGTVMTTFKCMRGLRMNPTVQLQLSSRT